MTTTISSLGGALKEVYGIYLNAVPSSAKLQMLSPFKESQKTGDTYDETVRLRNENGVTYYSEGSLPTLKSPRSFVTQGIKVPGSNMVLRGQLAYDVAAKASGGKQAFFDASREQMKAILESGRNRIEIATLYGRSPTGIGGYTATPSGGTSTTAVVVIPAAQWADGIWASIEDATIEFRENASPGTRVGGSGVDGVFEVTSVDQANTSVTVTGTTTGITALKAASGAHSIFFEDAYDTEPVGVDAILTNTGTLFGINAGTYSLWSANQATISGVPTVEGVNLATSDAAMRSTDDEDVDVFVNMRVWNLILNDQAALRRYHTEVKTYANGARVIEFHNAQGIQRYHGHRYVKRGDIFVMPTKNNLVRIGAQDLSFNRPGVNGEDIVRELDDLPAFEIRLFTNQAVFIRRPAACTKITGFTLS